MTITKATLRRMISEAQVQKQIMEYLTMHGWLVRQFAASGTHGRLRGSVPSGWPDLAAIKQGQWILVEVKGPRGKLSAAQEMEHRALRDAGATVIAARGIEDLEKEGEAWLSWTGPNKVSQ